MRHAMMYLNDVFLVYDIIVFATKLLDLLDWLQRRSERLPTVHCNRIIRKMAEFFSPHGVFSVFFSTIFGGLDS